MDDYYFSTLELPISGFDAPPPERTQCPALEQIIKHFRLDEPTPSIVGLFHILNGSEWLKLASNQPRQRMLFDTFWAENELCILFADTGLGKSILCVQIGDSISKGNPIQGFRLEASKQSVLYADFELSAKQFENRYSIDYQQHYVFSDNFLRLEINPDSELPQNKTFETFLNESLELAILQTGSKILIVDNITYLRTETEKAKDALPLMKELKKLKSKHGLSILCLAHTPKRDSSKLITRNDLQGSKMLINFCDSSFAIGESSQGKSLRYLKQVKVRNSEIRFDSENVALCEITKPTNFLAFNFLSYSNEASHLSDPRPDNQGLTADQKAEIIKQHSEGHSLRQLAERFHVSHQKIKRILDAN